MTLMNRLVHAKILPDIFATCAVLIMAGTDFFHGEKLKLSLLKSKISLRTLQLIIHMPSIFKLIYRSNS